MKLEELLTIAKYSELNTLAVADVPEAVTSFINLGVLELYNIFALDTEEYLITLQSGVTIYDLPTDFMYLVGAFEAPAPGHLESKNLPINEESNPYSVNTVNYNQVQIPLSTTGAFIGIVYVKKPAKLSADRPDEEVPIPEHLIQALLTFVAYKGHGALMLDGQQEGDVYYARFKQMCNDLKLKGTSIAADDLSTDTRLSTRGFP